MQDSELSMMQSPHLFGQIQSTSIKVLVRLIVEYSATVWDPCIAKTRQQVELIQRRPGRWVLGRYNRLDNVLDMLLSLKWRSLEPAQAN